MIKNKFKILIFISLLVITGLSGYILGTKYSSSSNKFDTLVPTKDTTNPIINQQIDSIPDYVPPKNAGINNCWNGNKNKKILNQRKCYFGNGLGMQNRHRHRYGQNQ
jgi:hypothetical protein